MVIRREAGAPSKKACRSADAVHPFKALRQGRQPKSLSAVGSKGSPIASLKENPIVHSRHHWQHRLDALKARYQAVRQYTEALASNLTPEDQCVQSMPDASPAKWHRAHTTWFFEEFLLRPHLPGYQSPDPAFRYLFNSYYEQVGARHPRPKRGLLTRPSADQVGAYRAHVDRHVERLLDTATDDLASTVELGLQHEQQHQELLVTDMLHAFAQNPIAPAIHPTWRDAGEAIEARLVAFEGGKLTLGAQPGAGFTFDNETPSHEALLAPFRLADRLVRNIDYLGFIQAGGYHTPTLWMADGWAAAQQNGWAAPLYWRQDNEDDWLQMGPGGLSPIVWQAPVRHISWYEADAYARWRDARLPTEQEWEVAARDPRIENLADSVWQWTGSAYLPYPRVRPPPGAIGEYNGKFMINQMVLRGGSCATPPGHARLTYRNFFPPDARWQFSGLRLAADV
jgi:ergothioneine biosynthesis protein EgtB